MVLDLGFPKLISGQRDVRETTPGLTKLQTNLDLNSFKIINVADPTSAQQAATKNYVDTTTASTSGSTFTGIITMDDGAGDSPALKWINGNDNECQIVCQNSSGDMRMTTTLGDIEMIPTSNEVTMTANLTTTGNATIGGNSTISGDISATNGTFSGDIITNQYLGTSADSNLLNLTANKLQINGSLDCIQNPNTMRVSRYKDAQYIELNSNSLTHELNSVGAKDFLIDSGRDLELNAALGRTVLLKINNTAELSMSSGVAKITGNLLVEGGNIGLQADQDLLQIATNSLTINGTIDATSHQINNVTDPTSNQDVATKNYVDNNNLLSGGTATGNITLDDNTGDSPKLILKNANNQTGTFYISNTNNVLNILTDVGGIKLNSANSEIDVTNGQIKNVLDPTNNQDAATKKYVDDNTLGGGGTATGNITLDDGVGSSPKSIYVNASDHTASIYCQTTSGDLRLETDTGRVEFSPAIKEIDVGASKIKNALSPSLSSDVATKGYVDGLIPVNIKEVSFAAGELYSTDTTMTTSGNYAMHSFADGVTNSVYMNWIVPQDFSSMGIFKIYWRALSAASNVGVWKFEWSFAGSNEDKDNTTGSSGELTSTNNGSDKVNYLIHLPSGIGTISPGDILSLKISRVGSSASDTLSSSAEILAVGIQYDSR